MLNVSKLSKSNLYTAAIFDSLLQSNLVTHVKMYEYLR